MQSRLAIVLMSVAGAGVLFCLGLAFGLGVMSSPPAETHKQIAITTAPTKVARQETTGSATHDDDRALTPLYPARPGGPSSPPAAQAAQARQQPAQQQQQQATTQPQQAQQQAPAPAPPAPTPTQQAKADTPPAPPTAKPAAAAAAVSTPKAATPVSLESRNACDVRACARAYRSFRESDCSYQPYSGPRQLCVSPPGAKEASRSRDPERATRGHDLRNAAPNSREDSRADDGSRTVVLRYHRD